MSSNEYTRNIPTVRLIPDGPVEYVVDTIEPPTVRELLTGKIQDAICSLTEAQSLCWPGEKPLRDMFGDFVRELRTEMRRIDG